MKQRYAVVFDLDGTLIDARQAIVRDFNSVLAAYRLPVYAEEQILRMMGRPLPEMFLETARLHELEVGQLVLAYVEHSRSADGQGIRLLPGARNLLENCRSVCSVGVATSRTTASARRILNRLEIDHLLPEIVGLDQVTNPKPHPEGVHLALNRLGATPANSIMLGDTPDDIAAAIGAGVRAFGVATGYFSVDALRAAGAAEVFSSLVEFEIRLNQLYSRTVKGRTT